MCQIENMDEEFKDLFSEFDECKDKTGDEKLICQFEWRYRHWMFRYAGMLAGDKNYKRNALDLRAIQENNADLYNAILGDANIAILTLLNPYFDAIGFLCGDDDRMDLIFPEKGEFEKDAKTQKSIMWHNVDTLSKDIIAAPNNDEKEKLLKNLRRITKQRVYFGLSLVFENYLKTCKPQVDSKTSVVWHNVCKTFYEQIRNPIAHANMPSGIIVLGKNEIEKPKYKKYTEALYWNKEGNKLVINCIAWYETIYEHFKSYMSELKDPKNQLRTQFLTRHYLLGK